MSAQTPADEPIQLEKDELLEEIKKRFNISELDELIFNLSYDSESRFGKKITDHDLANYSSKTLGLIEICDKRDLNREMINRCSEMVPNVDWNAFIIPALAPKLLPGGSEPPGGPEEKEGLAGDNRKPLLIIAAALLIIVVLAVSYFSYRAFWPDPTPTAVVGLILEETPLTVPPEPEVTPVITPVLEDIPTATPTPTMTPTATPTPTMTPTPTPTPTMTPTPEPPPRVIFDPPDPVDESDQKFELIVKLDGARSYSVTVPYETNAGSATSGEDYEPTQDDLTFVPGQDSQTISVKVKDDQQRELDEVFELVLSDATGLTMDAEVTIRDDKDDQETICDLSAEQRLNQNLYAGMLSLKTELVNLRYQPSRTGKVIDTVSQDDIFCVIGRTPTGEELWYLVRLTEEKAVPSDIITGTEPVSTTVGWIGGDREVSSTYMPLKFFDPESNIDVYSYNGSGSSCKEDGIVGIVDQTNIRKVEDLCIEDSGKLIGFIVALTFDDRPVFVLANEIDTTAIVPINLAESRSDFLLRVEPGSASTFRVNWTDVLWASERGLKLEEEVCYHWYKVRLRDGREGWVRGTNLYQKAEGLQEPLQELLLNVEHGRCSDSELMETSGDGS